VHLYLDSMAVGLPVPSPVVDKLLRELPMTRQIRTIALTEVALALTIIAVRISGPHPAYAYVVVGVLGLIVQVLAIVIIVRAARHRSGPPESPASSLNGTQLA
jgi:membrane protein YdbS with pleckstrin-like domain